MKIEATAIPDVKLIAPRIHRDPRGFFSETWSQRDFAAAGLGLVFVQDNHALSREQGVVRGLHFQLPPRAQGKLIRVVRGAIFDVVVDIRRGSPTFGRHVALELSADNWAQLWVPAGFAHGYATLTPDTEVIYKVTDFYSPADDRGILWNDPALAIPWPVGEAAAILSDKDRRLPRLSDLADAFP